MFHDYCKTISKIYTKRICISGTLPSQPQRFQLEDYSVSSLKLSWQPPKFNDKNVQYDLIYRKQHGSPSLNYVQVMNQSSIIFMGHIFSQANTQCFLFQRRLSDKYDRYKSCIIVLFQDVTSPYTLTGLDEDSYYYAAVYARNLNGSSLPTEFYLVKTASSGRYISLLGFLNELQLVYSILKKVN